MARFKSLLRNIKCKIQPLLQTSKRPKPSESSTTLNTKPVPITKIAAKKTTKIEDSAVACYNNLPNEIKIMIWEFAVLALDPMRITMTGKSRARFSRERVPSVLHINSLSRHVARRTLFIVMDFDQTFKESFYIDVNRDTLCIDLDEFKKARSSDCSWLLSQVRNLAIFTPKLFDDFDSDSDSDDDDDEEYNMDGPIPVKFLFQICHQKGTIAQCIGLKNLTLIVQDYRRQHLEAYESPTWLIPPVMQAAATWTFTRFWKDLWPRLTLPKLTLAWELPGGEVYRTAPQSRESMKAFEKRIAERVEVDGIAGDEAEELAVIELCVDECVEINEMARLARQTA